MSYEIKNQTIDATNSQSPPAGPLMPPKLDLDVERSVRMHPVLAGSVAAAVLLGMIWFAMRQKSTYSAQTTVYVTPIATKLVSDGTSGNYDGGKYDSYVQQEVLTASRADVLRGAVQSLPPGVWQQPGETIDQAVDRLEGALKVARVPSSYQMTFSVTDGQKDTVAPLANAVTAAFLKLGRKDELSQNDDRLQLLSEERDRISKEMEAAREEQRQLSASIGVANPAGDAGNPYDVQLAALREQLTLARQAHDVAASQLETVSGPTRAALDTAAEEMISSDGSLSSMKTEMSGRKAALATQMAGMTANNPLYRQDQEELDQIDKSLDTMTAQMREKAARRLQDKLRLDLSRTAAVEAKANAELARATATATGASPKLQRAQELAADLARMQARYATIDDSMRGLALESSSPGLAHLVVAATTPDGPDPSRRSLFLLVALPLALFCGAAAAVIVTKRDRHIYIGREIEKLLGFQPIAVLPSAQDVDATVVDEYILRLAGGIDQALRRGHARSYLLTGSSPTVEIGELARALVEKLAQLGFRTAFVSANTVLQSNTTSGVGPDSVEISKAWAQGALDRRHQSVLMANIERLKYGHDLLLIEAEPLLGSAETEYVSRLADVTIVVAQSGVTLREDLVRCGTLLKRLSASGVAAVLTELRVRNADSAFRSALRSFESRQGQSIRSTQDEAAWPPRRSAYASEPQPRAVPYTPPVMEADSQEYPQVESFADVRPVVSAEPEPVSGSPEPTAHIEAEPAHQPEPVAEVIAPPMADAEPESQEVASLSVPEHWEEPMLAAEQEHVDTHEPIEAGEAQMESAMSEIARHCEQPEPVPHVEAVAEQVGEPEPTVFAQYAASAAHFNDLHEPVAPVQEAIEEAAPALLMPYAETIARAVEPAYPAEKVQDAVDLHFNHDPNVSRSRLAFRGSISRVKVEEAEPPKKSWMHRLFRREPQVVYSIIPDDDSSEVEIPAYTPQPAAHRASQYVPSDDIPTAEIPAATPALMRPFEAADATAQPTVETLPVVSEPHPAPAAFNLQPHAEELTDSVVHAIRSLPDQQREPWGTSYLSGSAIQTPFPSVVHHDALPTVSVPVVDEVEPTVDETVSAIDHDQLPTLVLPAHDQLEPSFEAAQVQTPELPVQAYAEAAVEPAVEPVSERMYEPISEAAAEPVTQAFAALAPEPVVEQAIEPVAAESVQEPVAESVATYELSLEPIADLPAVAAAITPEPVSEQVDEPEVHMPLVPMRSDFKEPSYEALAQVAKWKWDPLDVEEPTAAEHEPQSAYTHESDLYSVYSAREHRIAYQPAAAADTAVVEPEPVRSATRYLAQYRQQPEAETSRPARERSSRFHLLNHFDRPIVLNGDAPESQESTYGGSR